MPVYQEEEEFLCGCRELLVNGNLNKRKVNPKFTGLSREGQDYLGNLLNKKAIQYLLEKGASIPGTVWYNEKRIENYSILNYPIQISFSPNIYHLLIFIFDKSHKLPKQPNFTLGDNIVLLILVENVIQKNPKLYTQDFWKYISYGYFPSLFYLPKLVKGDQECHLQKYNSFLKTTNVSRLVFGLRYFWRDVFALQFKEHLLQDDLATMEKYGNIVEKLLSPLFEVCEENEQPEWITFLCESYEYLFAHGNHIDRINEKVHERFGSDRQRALGKLLSCYTWIRKIDNIHQKAIKSRGWDEDYEMMNIIKKYYTVVSKEARKNALETLEHLENVV